MTVEKESIITDKGRVSLHPEKRIVFLDVLRGLSIFGIFLANLQWFSFSFLGVGGKYVFPETDGKLSFLYAVFIDGKFYSIFSLLFGWGIALQMDRLHHMGMHYLKYIYRRLYFMLLLGAIHLFFIWEGDIVFFYALVGFILVYFRNYSNRTLVKVATLLLLSPILLYALKMVFPLFNYPAIVLTDFGNYLYKINGLTDPYSKSVAYLKSESVLTDVWLNLCDFPYRYADLFFVSRIPKVLGAMLTGFVIGRSGVYKKLSQYKKQLLFFAVLVTVIALPLNYFLALLAESPKAYYALEVEGLYYTVLYAFAVFPLAMAYVVGLALLFESGRIRFILALFAPVGKMAFSNYIMQSAIGIFTFYGIGIGMMYQMGPFSWTLLAIGILVLQIIVSTLWLRYFRFGPIEWVWRSLTYSRMQPLRIKL